MTLETIDLRRVASALLVVLFHGLILLALLRAAIHQAEKSPPAREVVLHFVQPSAPTAKKPEVPPPPVRLIAPITPFSPAPGEATTPPAPNITGSLRDLYFYLYECTPENFANLTEAEKTKCAQASLTPVPDDSRSVRNLPSRAKDAQRWERALARKKNPALLPCMSPGGINLLGTALCLGKSAVKGSFGDLDDAPGYGDAPSVVRDPSTGVPAMSRAPQSPIESVGKP
jgi:hypothetical protein